MLLVGFFNERRRLLHDFLLGTVVINNERPWPALRRYRCAPGKWALTAADNRANLGAGKRDSAGNLP